MIGMPIGIAPREFEGIVNQAMSSVDVAVARFAQSGNSNKVEVRLFDSD